MNALAPRPIRATGLDRAREEAAAAADAVDREARFPAEAFAAIRQAGLLGAMVPASLGGLGLSLRDVCNVTASLAACCGSTGLVFAMHQIQVACLKAEPDVSDWERWFLARVAAEGLLLGSVTSELGIGGNVRRSSCAIEPDAGGFVLRKRSPSISYGAQADALLVTARRGAKADPSDQVLVVAPPGSYDLTGGARWDTLGMRGTCSDAFDFEMRGGPEQILARPFAEICESAMLPASHLLWGAAWLGIVDDVIARASASLRHAARALPGAVPNGAARVATACSLRAGMRSRLAEALDMVERGAVGTIGCTIALNELKVSLSETANDVVRHAMLVCGIGGYRNDGDASLGRHLRDLQSAPLMVGNDRISATISALLVSQRPVGTVF